MQQRFRVIYYKVGQDFAQLWMDTNNRDTAEETMWNLAAIRDVAGVYVYDGELRKRINWTGNMPEVFFR